MTLTHRLVWGTSQLTLSNGVMRLLSLVTMPILTALVAPDAYGVATLVGTVISLVSVIALAGIDVSYARAYHSANPPHGHDVEHYCWRVALLAALLISAIAGLVWFVMTRQSSELDHSLALLVAIGTFLSVAQAMAQTRARLEHRYTALAMSGVTAGLFAAVSGICIAMLWRQDALALLLPMLLTYLMPVLLLGTPSIAALTRPSRLTRAAGTALLKVGIATTITAPMYWLLSSSDRWFLQYYHGTQAVGVYSLGYSVAILGTMVNGAVASVLLPEASREYERDASQAQITLGRLMSRLAAAMALVWLAVAAGGGDVVRWLANERFHAAADFIPFIAAGVFFNGILHLGNVGLVLKKRLIFSTWWWAGGGLICVLLNLAIVPGFGGIGAAIAQCISFAFIASGVIVTSLLGFRVQVAWGRLSLILLIVVIAGVFMTRPWHGSAPLSLLLKLPVGIMVAGAVAWLIAPDWCARCFQFLRLRWS